MSEVSTSPSSVDTTTPADLTGVSNPPDGGEVRSVDTPQDQMQTPPQGQPQAQQPQAAAPDQAGQADQSSQPSQPGQSQPDLSKPQDQAPPPAPKPDLSQHPAVQRAGIMHTIAETLAGGPRFRESIDVNTGEMKRERVPMSRADIGMAIAMEAISGALGGLTQKGPGATGMAAEAGFQKVAAQQQQVQQQQDANATADFTRHYQVLDTNMRLYQNALTVGKMSREENDAYVSQFSDIANKMMNDHPEMVKGIVNYSDFGKYHVTMDSAIPYKVVPRLDPATGKQVTVNGVPQSDIQYIVVDPSFKADDFLNEDQRAAMKKFGVAGMTASNLPQSLPMKLGMAINLQSKVAGLQLFEKSIGQYRDGVNRSVGGSPTKMPELKDKDVQDKLDQAAERYNVPKALVRAVALQESKGKQDAVSAKGALGVMQLMPDTAKQLGIDPNDPDQNIDGGVKYLAQQLKNYKGDMKLALAAYNAGPGNVQGKVPNFPETQNYVKSITDSIGYDENAPAPKGDQKFDLAKELQADPKLATAIEKFQPLLNKTSDKEGVHYDKALAALQDADPQAAAKMYSMLGGPEQVAKFQQNQFMALREREDDESIRKADEIQQNKAKRDQEGADRMHAALAPPENFQLTEDMKNMSQRDLERALKAQGVTVPDNFADLYAIGKAESSTSDLANRVWRKGDPYGMSRSDAASFVRTFINDRFNEGDFDNLKKLQGDFTYGRGEASQIKSVNTLFHHIYDASEAINSLRNGKSPLLNKGMNEIKGKVLGDPAISSMLAAIEPVKHEFMTFLNNGNALTETDKKAGDDILNISLSPAQLQEQFRRFAETSADRLLETNEKYKDGFGVDFRAAVSPQSLPLLRKMPTVAARLKDLRVGGDLAHHNQGKTVAELLGMQDQQGASRPAGVPNTVRPPQTGEKPVWVNGKFAGYTSDGKSYTFQYNGQ